MCYDSDSKCSKIGQLRLVGLNCNSPCATSYLIRLLSENDRLLFYACILYAWMAFPFSASAQVTELGEPMTNLFFFLSCLRFFFVWLISERYLPSVNLIYLLENLFHKLDSFLKKFFSLLITAINYCKWKWNFQMIKKLKKIDKFEAHPWCFRPENSKGSGINHKRT